MWRDDPIDEPWYELDFRMSRWSCPSVLPSPLVEDVIEAIREMDQILFDTMKLVDRFSYGVETAPKRYIRESAREVFKAEFERAEDQFLVARAHLAAHWASIVSQYQAQIFALPKNIQAQLNNPHDRYSIVYSVIEVQLNEAFRQFLEGIRPDNEQMVLSGNSNVYM
jgi:hypothetical protein